MKVVLGMLFFFFSNANFQFDVKKLTWRFYTITETLSTTSPIKPIYKRKFAKAVLNKNLETSIMHVSALEVTQGLIYFSWAPQIAALQWG